MPVLLIHFHFNTRRRPRPSKYQQSKFAAEKLVAASSLNWTIVRPGNVYGPGDQVISMLLKIARGENLAAAIAQRRFATAS